jgi:hypothetical protein
MGAPVLMAIAALAPTSCSAHDGYRDGADVHLLPPVFAVDNILHARLLLAIDLPYVRRTVVHALSLGIPRYRETPDSIVAAAPLPFSDGLHS